MKKVVKRVISLALVTVSIGSLLSLGVTSSAQDDPVQKLRNSVVRVFCYNKKDANTYYDISFGSGFAIGNSSPVDTFVTNSHVINHEDGSGAYAYVNVYLGRDQIIRAKVIMDLPKTDLAVIKLDQPIARDPVSIRKSDDSNVGSDIYTLGYPGSADHNISNSYIQSLDSDPTDITTTKGIISKLSEFPDLDNLQVYQTDASINSGNSGGPMVDAQGNVIGIVEQKRKDADGIGYAIRSQELIKALDNVLIKYNSADTAPSVSAVSKPTSSVPATPATNNNMVILIICIAVVVVILAALAVVLVLILGGKKRNSAPQASVEAPKPAPAAAPRPMATVATTPAAAPVTPTVRPVQKETVRLSRGQLFGINGSFEGQTIEITGEQLFMGRDAAVCQLVFPEDALEIGKKHCSVKYDTNNKVFILEDCNSTNGTFLQSGQKLPQNGREFLKSEDRFYLSTINNTFEVRIN